jgi:hypothetical protein
MRERVRSRFYLCDEDYFMKRLNAEMIPLRKRIMQNLVLWKKRKAKVYLLAFPGLIEADYSDGLIAELLEKNYGHSKFIFFNHRRYPVIQEAERKLFSSIANDYEIKYFDFTSLMKGLPAYEKVKPRYFVDAIHTGPVINEAIAQGLKESILEELE